MKNPMSKSAWILVLGCVLASAGCETSDSALEIEGTYTDPWGGAVEITSDQVTLAGMGRYLVASFDNGGNWLVAQNAADNDYNPDLWSRFDWTEHAGSLYLCQTAYAAATEAAARDTAPADPSDPANGGCGGFAWTLLTPAQ
ncbi:MAG TPA: hypothetical protein PK313_10815 [Myxococcota bacterium]|nr:hypothetical protein [Myxococcota bacterium]